jgi:hypothetical protein
MILCMALRPTQVTGQVVNRGLKPIEEKVAEFDRGDKWAVVVGINEYDDPDIRDLKCCVADARLIARTLLQSCDYKEDHLLTITDQEEPRRQPRDENLWKEVRT